MYIGMSRRIKIGLTFNIRVISGQTRVRKKINHNNWVYVFFLYLYKYIHTYILLYRAKMKCVHIM